MMLTGTHHVSTLSARIDETRTNLASALRVGAGMLPADARRRLVRRQRMLRHRVPR